MSSKGLIVFAKKPEPGKVKTRLQPQVGSHEALLLYQAFVVDTLARLSSLKGIKIFLGCFPNSSDPWFTGLSKRFGLHLFNQEGNDLGERMASAFVSLEVMGIRQKVIVGTDAPHLPLGYVENAFTLLESDPVVIGPSRDGGYYLLGIRGSVPDIFSGVAWSTPSVFNQTIERLKKGGVNHSLLPEWFDVDSYDDLLSLREHLKRLKEKGEPLPAETAKLVFCSGTLFRMPDRGI